MGSRGYSRAIAAGLAAFLAALVLFAADGRATDLGHDSYKAAPPAPTSQWELDVTPYGWFINLEGDLEFGIVRHSVQYNFIEILTDTETPYEIDGAFELRKGLISFFGRLDFMKLEVDQVSTFDLRPVGFFEIDVNADVNVTTDNLILEGGASLELFKTALGAAAGDPLARSGFVAFDLLGGARYNNLKITSDIEVDIREDFDPKFIPLRITGEQRIVRRIEQDNSWVDPFVGGRVRMETPGAYRSSPAAMSAASTSAPTSSGT